MPKSNEIDNRILSSLVPSDSIRILLRDAGHSTVSKFALAYGHSKQEVSFCITGARQYPEIRDHLAEAIGVTRSQIDEVIDGPVSTPKPAA